jgi:thymidylate synthase (FAD)
MVRIVQQSFKVLYFPDGATKMIEVAGRTCYKSEDHITDESADGFTNMLLARGHEAMIEFGGDPVVHLVCNRGLSHELVRHRLASYAQESTRYCNYSKTKFGGEIRVVNAQPWLSTNGARDHWLASMQRAEDDYFGMLGRGEPAQLARGVLPIDLKTEVVTKMNIRQWRYLFSLRAAKAAHPQMRALAGEILVDFRKRAPVLFNNIGSNEWVLPE